MIGINGSNGASCLSHSEIGKIINQEDTKTTETICIYFRTFLQSTHPHLRQTQIRHCLSHGLQWWTCCRDTRCTALQKDSYYKLMSEQEVVAPVILLVHVVACCFHDGLGERRTLLLLMMMLCQSS